MGKNKPEICPKPEVKPGLLAQLFTEADILAKRHEFEQDNEERQKQELVNLERTICELEQKKNSEEVIFRDALHKVALKVKRAESKIIAAKEQHQQCIEDVIDQYEKERAGYLDNLKILQTDLEADKQTFLDKQDELKRAEIANLETLEKRAQYQAAMRDEIQSLQKKLAQMAASHQERKRQYKKASDERIKSFKLDSDKLQSHIDQVRTDTERRNVKFRKQEMELIRARDEILGQQQLDREEMKVRMGGLLMEKEDFQQRIAFLQNKVQQRQETEKKRAIVVNKQFDEILRDNTDNFKREKDECTRRLMMKEDELHHMEADLVKIREDHDGAIKRINQEIDQKAKFAETQMKIKEENYRTQIETITDKRRHRDMEDKIHNNRCVIMSLEVEQQAEEDFLQTRLKALAEKEKYLRDALSTRQIKSSDHLIGIQNELSQAKAKANFEQHDYDTMKEDLDRKVAEAHKALETNIREATSALNALGKDICDIKRDMKEREEAAKDREDNSERRIGDEVRRLQTLKSDLEEKIRPLEEKHNELKTMIRQEIERNEETFKAMSEECNNVRSGHQKELEGLQAMLSNSRQAFNQEKDDKVLVLKQMLDQNDELRRRHENELYVLNKKLIASLRGQATFDDKDPLHEKLKSLKDLQDMHVRKTQEYEDMIVQGFKEQYAPDKNHEGAMKQMVGDFDWMRREYVKDGIRYPEERLQNIRSLLDTKKKNQGRSGGDDQSPIMDNVEEAKFRNTELKEKISSKKKDLQSLMNKRQKEISDLTKDIQKYSQAHATTGEPARGSEDASNKVTSRSEIAAIEDVDGSKPGIASIAVEGRQALPVPVAKAIEESKHIERSDTESKAAVRAEDVTMITVKKSRYVSTKSPPRQPQKGQNLLIRCVLDEIPGTDLYSATESENEDQQQQEQETSLFSSSTPHTVTDRSSIFTSTVDFRPISGITTTEHTPSTTSTTTDDSSAFSFSLSSKRHN